MASTVGDEKAGNQDYQKNHMALLFEQGLSFSGFERDALFLNREGNRFQDISGVSGIDSISDGRSAVTVDLDNDGDLDIFLTTNPGGRTSAVPEQRGPGQGLHPGRAGGHEER